VADAAPAVLALVGPTASGKSALALQVAARIGAEIVAVDAFTVYRGMDVGTAKPTVADRAAVPHHMVDVLDPDADASVAWFQGAARAAVADVLARGRRALLVGGSGLYFRAVVDDLEFPPTDAGLRAALAARWCDDPAGAHALLAARDPAAAALVDPGNLRRTVRALEVIELTARPFSDWRRAWDRYESRYPGLIVVGVAMARDQLAVRIPARAEAMLAGGLVEECAALAARPLSATASQAIGYAEVFDHLAGRCTLAQAVERTVTRTRRYATRQARWFAADPRVGWFPPTDIPEVLAACGS